MEFLNAIIFETTLHNCFYAGMRLLQQEPARLPSRKSTVREVMDSMVEPNADFLWGAVATRSTKEGVIEKAPKTADDWKELREHAISLREATNVIQIPNRSVAKPGEKAGDPRIELTPELIQTMIESDRTTWANHAHELYDAVEIYLKGVDAKSVDGISDAGENIDKACENCHLRYWYPNRKRANRVLFALNNERVERPHPWRNMVDARELLRLT